MIKTRGNRRWGIAAMAAVLMTMAAAGALPMTVELTAADRAIYDERADAHQLIDAAIRDASKARKNIVLDFGANWCGDCHALDAQMRSPDLASLIEKSYVVVHIDVGRMNRNVDLTQKYGIPLQKGIPALAVLDQRGKLLYSQDQGQFEDARHLGPQSFKQFFEQWRPKVAE